MTPREIIAEAWAITQRETSLRRWGITSSFFELLLSLKLISYQIYFLYEYLAGHTGGGFFDVEIIIYNSMPRWFFWTFVIFFVVLFVIEIFFPHLAHGAVIGLAAKSHKGEKVEGGLVLALYNFFPIFAIHEFFLLSSLSTAITAISVVLRYIEGTMQIPIVLGIIGLWAFSNLLKFFFSFAQEAAVIQKMSIFEALGHSFKLIVSYLGKIMFLLLLLFVISLRILLNAVMVLLIPGIVVGVAMGLMWLFSSHVIAYVAAGIVGIALIAVSSYFFGVLHVFNQTVWTITYIELRKNKDLDIID